MGLSLVLALAALLFFWAAGVRQRLLASRVAVVQAFAQLELQLYRRHEALADLAESLRAASLQARDAVERVMAARLQVMAAAELVRSGPALAGPIKSLDLAEASVAQAVAGLTNWIEAAQVASAGPVPEPTPGSDLLLAWQRLNAARQSVQFASQSCNQCLSSHNASVVRLPARVVAAWMGLSPLPLLTVAEHG